MPPSDSIVSDSNLSPSLLSSAERPASLCDDALGANAEGVKLDVSDLGSSFYFSSSRSGLAGFLSANCLGDLTGLPGNDAP